MILQKIHKSKLLKLTAVFIAVLIFDPIAGYRNIMAFSGGPTQPEFSKYTVVGASDLVDPFTGNVGYSVPLFEIGGYPVALGYSGDIHPEQDAGWVGLGWSLNLGSINRALSGVPDDFNGEDKIATTESRKPHISVSGDFTKVAAELAPMQAKADKTTGNEPKPFYKTTGYDYKKSQLSIGFVYDNYTGLQLSFSNKKRSIHVPDPIGIMPKKGLNVDNFESEYEDNKALLEAIAKINGETVSATKKNNKENGNGITQVTDYNRGFGFSTGGGIDLFYMSKHHQILNGAMRVIGQPSLHAAANETARTISGMKLGAPIHALNQAFTPNLIFAPAAVAPISEMTNRNYTIGFDWSKTTLVNFRNISLDLDFSITHLAKSKKNPERNERSAIGAMFINNSMERGSGHFYETPITDIQEHGNTIDKFSRELNTGSINYDVFNISAAGIGGSFRVHSNSLVMYSPPTVKKNVLLQGASAKVEVGSGPPANTELGIDVGLSMSHEKYGKISKTLEKFDLKFDPKFSGVNNNYEEYSLKNDFEFIENQKSYTDQFGNTELATMQLTRIPNRRTSLARFTGDIKVGTNILSVTSQVFKPKRDARQQVISKKTASLSSSYGLINKIESYKMHENGVPAVVFANGSQTYHLTKNYIDRVSDYRKGHHISEITVTQPDGSRYYFGIPTYNKIQENYSFSVSKNLFSQQTLTDNPNTYNYANSTVSYFSSDRSTSNKKGIDQFFNKTEIPGYATSFLLSAVLTPDYIDKTGDGPSEDDLGNYVKFNYWQATDAGSYAGEVAPTGIGLFNWRSSSTGADLNLGVKSDNQDDKASFSYGQKELWYAHSIETKDEIAFFYLKKRDDGHQVLTRDGGQDFATDKICQYHIDKIAIFTKNEFKKLGLSATPLKVIHFEYDYSLCKNYSYNKNEVNGIRGGKLTLKKIWFTYGKLGTPTSAPYEFEYTNNFDYSYKSIDRWGVYSPIKSANSVNDLNSADHPFTEQNNRTLANTYAAAWMLKKINLPSGGTIEIEYEADDYAFVHDKQAMEMLKIVGFSDREALTPEVGAANDLYAAPLNASRAGVIAHNLKRRDYIIVKKPSGSIASDLIEPGEMIYYNVAVDLSSPMVGGTPSTVYEPVNGYVEVSKVGDINSEYAFIQVKKEKAGIFNVNPIFRMAIQQGIQKCPWLFYPAKNPKRYEDMSPVDFVTNSLHSIPEFLSLLTNKIAYFQLKQHCRKTNLNNSFIRCNKTNGFKVGGGHRVKSVTISDNWQQMSGENSASYTLKYDYTKTEGNKIVSSGVASYEPIIGAEDNPNRYPKLVRPRGIAKLFGQKESRTAKDLEKIGPQTISFDLDPVGEEFYTSAIVGYSRVQISTVYPQDGTGSGRSIKKHKTGTNVIEFYTTRDFPFKSQRSELEMSRIGVPWSTMGGGKEAMTMDKNGNSAPKKKLKFGLDISINIQNTKATQGFVIETNDMHGKIKSNLVYTEDMTTPFSGSEYTYKTDVNGNLVNNIQVIRPTGDIAITEAGLQVEPILFGSEYSSTQHQIAPSFDHEMYGTVPTASLYLSYNLSRKLNRIVTLTKHVRRSGLIDKVKVYDKGSAMETKNIAWDALTGQTLITQVHNEHKDAIYSIIKPAHWMYNQLGGAYNTQGMDLILNVINGEAWDESSLIEKGDELIAFRTSLNGVSWNTSPNIRMWVLDKRKDPITNKNYVSFIDREGNTIDDKIYHLILIKPGKKNILGVAAETISTTKNPIVNGKLQIDPSQVIVGSAVTFEEKRQLFEKFGFCWKPVCLDGSGGTSSEPIPGFGNKAKSQFLTNCENSQYDPFYSQMNNSAFEFWTPASGGYIPGSKVNPFTTGIWGNWKTHGSYVYNDRRAGLEDRTQTENPNNSDGNFTYNRVDGKIKNYIEFWQFKDGIWSPQTQKDTANPWTWSGTINYIDEKANAHQSTNAIDTPSAVLFGYQDRKLPVAMASNAFRNEIIFDGFEDIPVDAYLDFYCDNGQFSFYPMSNVFQFNKTFSSEIRPWPIAQALTGTGNRVTTEAFHSGWKSLKLVKGITPISFNNNQSIVNPNASFLTQYNLQHSDFIPKFYTDLGRMYQISYWVKENTKNQFSITMTGPLGFPVPLAADGKEYSINGWRKVTLKFKGIGNVVTINLNNAGHPTDASKDACYLDDFRIQPLRAQMVGYVYDFNNFRLMATLDDNNFCTFFEYDAEGSLIRKKIETINGIQTLEENRNSLRR